MSEEDGVGGESNGRMGSRGLEKIGVVFVGFGIIGVVCGDV